MVQSKLYKEAVEIFGKDNQMIVAVGEMAECSAEIARMFISNRDADEDAIVEEIADVCIMMEQMKVIYGERLITAVNKKLNKVEAHIERERTRLGRD